MPKNTKHGTTPCWEVKKCGRVPGGDKVAEFGICPAYPDNGRFCWSVAGTLCTGKPQGTYAEKINSCFFCEVFLKIKEEEGRDFTFLDLDQRN